jgi:hypothetical protein
MRKFLIAAATMVIGLAASPIALADYIFAGIGSSGTLVAASETWTLGCFGGPCPAGTTGWGSPGVSLSVTAYGEAIKAVDFEITFTNSKRSRFVTIQTPNKANFKRDNDGKLVEQWLRTAGFIIAERAAEENVDDAAPAIWAADTKNFQPRFGFTYTISPSVIVRGRRADGDRTEGHELVLAGPGGPGAIRDAGGPDRVLFPADAIALDPVLRRGDWNECAVRAEGPRLTLWLNGVLAADFHEDDPAAPPAGRIGLLVRGAGASLRAREITVEALPPPSPRSLFAGAPPPPGQPKPSPLAPDEERATFSLPPGFEIELVLSEEDGVAKPITVVWDHAGHLWTMTALEYPVDGNDDPGAAAALYAEPRRDRVLVLDDPHGPAPRKPRVFADGLAIPLGLLPWRDGAFVQHGTDILFLRDTDGDGRADGREVVLTGFGVGDSHLLPHQFTRAPGGWILVAQGAFNNSRVRTRDGAVTDFHRTLLGRFTPDGRRFETIGWGPCNIWGLVLDGEGQVFIQEANDQGWPMMPFLESASYPLCGDDVPRPYAPPFPKTGEKEMGGTGLSGLAFSEGADSFPPPWRDVFFIARDPINGYEYRRLNL